MQKKRYHFNDYKQVPDTGVTGGIVGRCEEDGNQGLQEWKGFL